MVKVNFFIDGISVQAESGTTILQACRELDAQIPVFCYHKELSIAGNCRMCLVEQEKVPKPVASCATPVSEGMVIHTNSPMVKKAREGALEFLLINHPLDCPVCDQGGECDLQDITRGYARQHSRFDEDKRIVKDKDFGPIIKTVLTRCIHCTRCVRFATEVAGVPEMGALGRGEHMEIANAMEGVMSSEFSGNVIDLCPVGALTFKPYEFKARSWELKSTDSIDISDAVGAHIRIDSRDDEIMRILPRSCNQINGEWITDKTRLLYEGLKVQRLDRPYIRVNGKLQAAEWVDALELISKKIKSIPPHKIAGLVGDLADAESMFSMRELWRNLSIPYLDARLEGENISNISRNFYTFNDSFKSIENSENILIIGANPRYEAPILNLRLRSAYRKGHAKIFVIGDKVDLTYPYTYLGNNLDGIENFKNDTVILGSGMLSRSDIHSVLGFFENVNVLHKQASRVAALDLGIFCDLGGEGIIQAANNAQLDMLYLLGVDDDRITPSSGTFVVYQGHHGEKGAKIADVVLPGLSFAEKSGTYINLEGKIQETTAAVSAPGCAKEDWKIFRALSGILGEPLPFNTLEEVRSSMHLALTEKRHQPKTILENTGFSSEVVSCAKGDFYKTDVISRHSVTLQKVSKFGKEKIS